MLLLICTETTLQPCHQLVKVRIMTISIKTKVLIKSGTLKDDVCVELRTKRL